MWYYMFIWPKPGAIGACVGETRPENGRTTTEFGPARPEQDMMLKTKNTPRLARNAPFAHLGTPLGDVKVWYYRFICPKPGTIGACLGEKRPENGPYRDRIRISETQTGHDA